VFAAPWVGLGYELTPDYHERTRLMGTQNFIGQLAYVVSPWFLWIMTYKGFFADQVAGAAGLAIIVAVAMGLGVLPGQRLRERVARRQTPAQSAAASLASSGVGETLSSGPFLAVPGHVLVFNGFMLISSFQFYVIIYYVCGGDQDRGEVRGRRHGGRVSSFLVVLFVTWLGPASASGAFFVSTGPRWSATLEVVLLQPGHRCWWCCPRPCWPSAWAGCSP
jgi:GPH family glycoside/pentoside/hexuronide:cation symporter